MNQDSKIYVAGHRGLLGSAVVRNLQSKGFTNLLLKTSQELDLMHQQDTFKFFAIHKPDYVFMCAAKVGGIKANSDSMAEFMYRNLQIQNNLIHGSHLAGVKKLLFVGSSCMYPANSTIPINESEAKPGPFEMTNEGYAFAKMAGLRMCQYYRKQYGSPFICAIPTNLFGLNDNYDPDTSHLIPALIRKIHNAKVDYSNYIQLWGTGLPRREVLFSDDCADALVFLMENYSEASPVNVGTGEDLSIREIALSIAEALHVPLAFTVDPSKPDGIPRKVLDVSLLNKLGWRHKTSFKDGINIAYADFLVKYA